MAIVTRNSRVAKFIHQKFFFCKTIKYISNGNKISTFFVLYLLRSFLLYNQNELITKNFFIFKTYFRSLSSIFFINLLISDFGSFYLCLWHKHTLSKKHVVTFLVSQRVTLSTKIFFLFTLAKGYTELQSGSESHIIRRKVWYS